MRWRRTSATDQAWQRDRAASSLGDSVVTKRSLAGESMVAGGRKTVLPVAAEIYQCEAHNKLATNPEIQDKLFTLLHAEVDTKLANRP